MCGAAQNACSCCGRAPRPRPGVIVALASPGNRRAGPRRFRRRPRHPFLGAIRLRAAAVDRQRRILDRAPTAARQLNPDQQHDRRHQHRRRHRRRAVDQHPADAEQKPGRTGQYLCRPRRRFLLGLSTAADRDPHADFGPHRPRGHRGPGCGDKMSAVAPRSNAMAAASCWRAILSRWRRIWRMTP